MGKFKVGDRVYFKGQYPIVGAEPYDVGTVIDIITSDDDVYYTVKFDNGRLGPLTMIDFLLDLYDPIKEKERKYREELYRQIHKKVDPFEEEIWSLREEKNIKNFKEWENL